MVDARQTRVFWPALLLASLVGLVLRVEVGRKTFISFDEWQHLFMAASARWSDLAFELQTNAHPPLFFLLLRYVVKLGHVGLYRLISVASGTGSILVVGLIARKVIDSPTLQLVCASAFALSADAISISVEIRSYQLTVFLSLLAFLFWLRMFPGTDGRTSVRSCIAFAVCSSLAVSCHYSAVFFLAACLLILPLARLRWPVVAALIVPCAVFAVEYFVHAGVQPMQGYLFDFYFGATPNESVVSFIARNAQNFFNLFSPIELRSSTVFLMASLLICALVAWVLIRRRNKAVPIVFAMAMVLELLAASLAGKYPFGGMLRHQYIAGPFLLIAAFVVLDALPNLRYAIPAVVLAASIANAVIEVPKLIFYPGVVLLQPEFDAWHSAFPNARAVYLDHWGVIGYFIHTSEQPRSFVRHIPDPAVIDEYRTPDGVDIFYDKTRNVIDFSDPSVYRSLADCLRDSGVKELTLFFYSPGDKPIDWTPNDLENLIVGRATEQGLTTIKVVAGKTSLAAAFKLREPE
jgi:hypothetical protein